ncbi:k-cl co-transporter [Niveomyces insectorum RCEF 264]|uniref:K-cl co-transporter n=1 Tax=Niveomyces insectorum RCEF 264 TaxID=1081102 RepID=A0A162IA60_9HYPO|nr:k-cl co-transporter [Niveomyces insectorum RCEF 264]
MERADRGLAAAKKHKLGVVSGVYVPVCLSILSILMFLRFGLILGQIGLLGMLGLLVVSYLVDFITTLSLSAVASNGEVKGGGTYYLISRSLGPEFGGSIGLLFYLSQVLNTALNVVGLIDCLDLSFGALVPHGYWWGYGAQTVVLVVCTLLCLAGSALFAKASNALLVVLTVATLSIPLTALVRRPFADPAHGIEFTGLRLATLRSNLLPHAGDGFTFTGLDTFRDLFGILFPATSGIFAGASMSGDLRNPSKAIPAGTLWAMGSTFAVYLVVVLSLAASTAHVSLLTQPNIIMETSLWSPLVLAGECAVTFFSALMGLIGAAKLMQALGRDKLLPGLSVFAWGTAKNDEPLVALLMTYAIAQLALFGNLNQIATFISMGYMVTFFVMNLACFLLKIGSAPNFRPAFQFFSWQTALLGSVMSAAAMFFIDETYATSSVILLVVLFLLIHYLSPPKHWGDVSQNLIYHQVRKYLLRLKPEHIKFWRPQIILLANDPRRQTRLIQFCNSMKKGGLYILGHVIVTDDFTTGVLEAKLQQAMWSEYITEYSRIKAFVQLTMSPSITWGVRNLILASGLGGMRPNIAVLGFYNMEDLRASRPANDLGAPGTSSVASAASSSRQNRVVDSARPRRRRGDTSSRILEGILPTDVIKTEGMMKATEYLTILEDLALRHRINVAVAKGFHGLETPRADGSNAKKYIDLWPIQMSAELEADGKSVLTTNFDTYTLILQLGYILHSVPSWKRVYCLRVMVFVEYESEVDEERGRVEALLDKLRISAEVHVFWLAGGDLATYEAIIQGESDPTTERLVDEALKDVPWWHSLQAVRGKTSPQTTAAAPDAMGLFAGRKENTAMRRPSLAHIEELQKHQTVSSLARLGVSMGIRTQNLAGRVALRSQHNGNYGDDGSSDSDNSSSSSSSSSVAGDFDTDFNDVDSTASEGDVEELAGAAAIRQPLLPVPTRRKSHGDAIIKRPAMRRKITDKDLLRKPKPVAPAAKASPPMASVSRAGYGTMSATDFPSLPGGDSEHSEQTQKLLSPIRSAHSIASSSMRFSSNLVPETRITGPEDNSRQSRISLAESATSKKRLKITPRPSVSFVEPERDALLQQEQQPRRPFISRHSSTPVVHRAAYGRYGSGGEPDKGSDPVPSSVAGDVQVGIDDLVADYRSRRRGKSTSTIGQTDEGGGSDDDGISGSSGSSYATQDLPLSFNDLPSRAQHLILNELMRRQSGNGDAKHGGAAVLFTTLPIPEEGTSRDERASVQYLEDVELLCQGLPPVLMILSNNMTVTVNLYALVTQMKNPLKHRSAPVGPSAEIRSPVDDRSSSFSSSSGINSLFRHLSHRLHRSEQAQSVSPTTTTTAEPFHIVHFPDRPPVPIPPSAIPSEDECRYLLQGLHANGDSHTEQQRNHEQVTLRRRLSDSSPPRSRTAAASPPSLKKSDRATGSSRRSRAPAPTPSPPVRRISSSSNSSSSTAPSQGIPSPWTSNHSDPLRSNPIKAPAARSAPFSAPKSTRTPAPKPSSSSKRSSTDGVPPSVPLRQVTSAPAAKNATSVPKHPYLRRKGHLPTRRATVDKPLPGLQQNNVGHRRIGSTNSGGGSGSGSTNTAWTPRSRFSVGNSSSNNAGRNPTPPRCVPPRGTTAPAPARTSRTNTAAASRSRERPLPPLPPSHKRTPVDQRPPPGPLHSRAPIQSRHQRQPPQPQIASVLRHAGQPTQQVHEAVGRTAQRAGPGRLVNLPSRSKFNLHDDNISESSGPSLPPSPFNVPPAATPGGLRPPPPRRWRLPGEILAEEKAAAKAAAVAKTAAATAAKPSARTPTAPPPPEQWSPRVTSPLRQVHSPRILDSFNGNSDDINEDDDHHLVRFVKDVEKEIGEPLMPWDVEVIKAGFEATLRDKAARRKFKEWLAAEYPSRYSSYFPTRSDHSSLPSFRSFAARKATTCWAKDPSANKAAAEAETPTLARLIQTLDSMPARHKIAEGVVGIGSVSCQPCPTTTTASAASSPSSTAAVVGHNTLTATLPQAQQGARHAVDNDGTYSRSSHSSYSGNGNNSGHSSRRNSGQNSGHSSGRNSGNGDFNYEARWPESDYYFDDGHGGGKDGSHGIASASDHGNQPHVRSAGPEPLNPPQRHNPERPEEERRRRVPLQIADPDVTEYQRVRRSEPLPHYY